MAIKLSGCVTETAIGLIGFGEDMTEDDLGVMLENIFKLLDAKGMTQSALAKKVGLTSSGLSLKLKGKRDISIQEAGDIARALGVSLSALTNPDLVPAGAQLYADPLTALEALARHLGRETRPKRYRKKSDKPDDSD